MAAAVVFDGGAPRIRGLRDSKVLPEKKRVRLAERIRKTALRLGLGAASSREIDRFNIRVATALAMRRAIRRVCGASACRAGAWWFRPEAPVQVTLPPEFTVLIDGLPLPELGLPHEALVDGDALCYSIAAAGVVAKTVRDRLMCRLARRYPAYGWDHNMGYATETHRAAIDARGPTRHHRQSFAPVAQLPLW